MRHFLDINKTDPSDLRAMIDQAAAMKSARAGRPKGAPDDDQPLKGRMVALIFEKPSTRTRVSFDVGVRQMGGQTMVLTGSEMQLGHGETIADTARVLSRYVDLIMIRTFEEDVLLEMADHASVPVINGLTNRTHPCQIMADIHDLRGTSRPHRGQKGRLVRRRQQCLCQLCPCRGQFGFDLTFSGPPTLDPEAVFLDEARAKGARVTIERDPARAVAGADLVVTDTWVSMHDSQTTRERRHNQLRPYQVNEALMKHAKPEALFMHCLPAHRNDEVTDAVMDGPQSVSLTRRRTGCMRKRRSCAGVWASDAR
jgi:ornithine carbamoyltransferase